MGCSTASRGEDLRHASPRPDTLRPLPCPHSKIGSPDDCSQCRGVTPRVVRLDDSTLTIDGTPAEREFIPEHGKRRVGYSVSAGRAAALRVKRRAQLLDVVDDDELPVVDD